MNSTMPSSRSRAALTWCIGVAASVSLSLWAFRPLERRQELAEPPSIVTAPAVKAIRSDVDPAAFSVRLWDAPPPPVIAPAPAPQALRASPPPPTLKLQLVGIVTDAADVLSGGEAVARAALYDPDSDHLHLLRTGDRIAGFVVSEMTAQSVTLRRGAGGTAAVLWLSSSKQGAKRD